MSQKALYDIDYEDFRNKFAEITRHEKQKDSAEKLHLTATTLNKKLQNNGCSINVTDLLNIATTYSCSIDYLLGIDETAKQGTEKEKYSSFGDFISTFLRIYEHENISFNTSDDGKISVSFDNPAINSFLESLMGIQAYDKKHKDVPIYDSWKTAYKHEHGRLLKSFDYRTQADFFNHIQDVMQKTLKANYLNNLDKLEKLSDYEKECIKMMGDEIDINNLRLYEEKLKDLFTTQDKLKNTFNV